MDSRGQYRGTAGRPAAGRTEPVHIVEVRSGLNWFEIGRGRSMKEIGEACLYAGLHGFNMVRLVTVSGGERTEVRLEAGR